MMSESRLAEIELSVARWLSAMALSSDDEMALLEGFCEKLVAFGVPLLRVGTGTNVFHPIVNSRGYNWRRGHPVETEETIRNAEESESWRGSPFYSMLGSNETELRRTVGQTYRQGEFPMLDRFVRQGCTDYFAIITGFNRNATLGSIAGVAFSFQTDRGGGFDEGEIRLIRRVAIHFAHACKTMMSVHAGRVLVTTYLGRDPGRRVLDGIIEQGKADIVQAALWLSDLQGFTRIADTLPRDQLLGLLNDYADCLVSVITAHRGEVLKFVGDGIIAIFPFGEENPCTRALDAAEAALAAIDLLGERRSAAGLPHTAIHLALHVGDVLYGNIGSRERLDFTVVGPAVNEVARIEAMCRQLEQRVVISAAFAAAAGEMRARLVSLGRYALRGVRRPEELFTIDPR
jgi:adenylate cyclase